MLTALCITQWLIRKPFFVFLCFFWGFFVFLFFLTYSQSLPLCILKYYYFALLSFQQPARPLPVGVFLLSAVAQLSTKCLCPLAPADTPAALPLLQLLIYLFSFCSILTQSVTFASDFLFALREGRLEVSHLNTWGESLIKVQTKMTLLQ